MQIRTTASRSGQHGTWAIRQDGKTASGTWRTGTWEIIENDTGFPDEMLDALLNIAAVWPVPGVWTDIPQDMIDEAVYDSREN